MRIDRLLYRLRFNRSRGLAQKSVASGILRCNGMRVTRASMMIAVGDTLTIPTGRTVRLVQILALPERRGPAREAQACYRVLDPNGPTAVAAPATPLRTGIKLQ